MSVRAHELATLLERAPAGVTTLSLDCFDTLLWRDVHQARDVFAGIAVPGGGIEPRMWAESVARRMALQRSRSNEVGLPDIYRRMMPRGTPDQIDAAIAHELALEARHCFPFAPVVALMRDARARGLRIIIVSDMYLSEAELRELLERSAGPEIVGLIDHIFMSSAHGTPKAGDLFGIVLKTIGATPDQLIHVGDNRAADYDGAARAGIHAVHFEQFEDEVVQRLRLESAAGTMLDPATRVTVPSYQPHRAQLSLRTQTDTGYIVGHDVMGPVMHSFAMWLKAEIDAMAARIGKPVRPLFLMRDGYLPFAVFNTLYPDIGGHQIEISRLTAARASLNSAADVHTLIDEQIDVLPPDALAQRLMLHGQEVTKLLKKRPGESKVDDRAFRKAIRSPEMVRKILTRSRGFTDRLMAHLRANDVADGDAVMLVDLGYNGAVQNTITPVLEREMGLTVAGRYLILREEGVSGLDKAGMLGTDVFECRALHALCTNVAVLEQMCNVAQGSTVDYKSDGTPIREESGMKSFQNATRDRVQTACLDFARTAFDGMHRRPASDDIIARRRMAGSILTRLFFLPLPSEIALFEAFDHDVNLGTKVLVPLLDHDEAADGLRRRGIAYINETRRMYVPGEIARHGLSFNLSLLTTSRFALDLSNGDFEVGGIEVPVILLTDSDQAVMKFTAYPTHEGYYRVTIPVGMRRPTVAVQLGTVCETLQIDRATWTPITQFDGDWASNHDDAAMIVDGMAAIADGIYTAGETGVLVAMPPPATAKGAQVLTVVFRPLQRRGQQVASRAAA
jgi:FMN phosphatase YigB (HAD superfamily)